MSNQNFINSIKEGAVKAHAQYGICASLTIAQAILESGWGKSAPGNNLFGIKWQEGCGYDKQLLTTTEYYNGVKTTIQDYFRKYNSLADSIYDHAMFLVRNSRYKSLLGIKDYKTACKLIQQCGYATAPNYATSLIKIIEENRLYQYDNATSVENILITNVKNPILVQQIKVLQYNLNLDYNAKLKNVDGNIYQETLDALNGVKGIIVKGHKSNVVKWVQQKLIGYGYLAKGKDTGIYDEATFQAVTNMQKNWGRPTDGILRIETWNIFLNN